MKEVFYLNKETLPIIPVPHDCEIKDIALNDGFLEFFFVDDISWHDSIKAIKPEAKSLIIRYHLIRSPDDIDIIMLEPMKIRWWIRDPYARFRYLNYERLSELKAHGELSYNYHYVQSHSLFIKLCSHMEAQIELFADYVEYEWIC